MKNIISLLLCLLAGAAEVWAQDNKLSATQQKDIAALIDHYSEAREKSDTMLLKTILTGDIDQLVSTGEWRTGISEAIEGMLKSAANSPGTRILTIDKIRMLNVNCAIVDCRYEIANTNNATRKMWSSFVVVADKEVWRISAIRNMLPAGN